MGNTASIWFERASTSERNRVKNENLSKVYIPNTPSDGSNMMRAVLFHRVTEATVISVVHSM